MTIDTTINKYSLTNQDVIAALRRCANDRSVCDECVFCSDNVKKWRCLMAIGVRGIAQTMIIASAIKRSDGEVHLKFEGEQGHE